MGQRNIGALIIRRGFWGPLYNNYDKEPPKIVLVIIWGPYARAMKCIPVTVRRSSCNQPTAGPQNSGLLFVLGISGAPTYGFYCYWVPLFSENFLWGFDLTWLVLIARISSAS